MKKKGFLILLQFLLFLILSDASAIERRKEQFLLEQSYLIFPLPYSLEGIGKGIVVTALAGNVAETNVDAYFLGITGAARGSMVSIGDIHLLPKLFILEVQKMDIGRVTVNNYEKRGMDTKKDDYTIMELDKVENNYAKLTLSLLERRLEFFGAYERELVRVIKVHDNDGEIISNMENDPYKGDSKKTSMGIILDYTDDRQDPRKGLRLELTRSESPRQKRVDADYYVIDRSLSLYYPLAGQGTLALNYFASDARVRGKGDTDPSKIRNELGMNCAPSDVECLKAEQELVDMFIAQRSNGTATALGGENRLRAYSRQRYNGAHSLYYAAEVRWNFSQAVRPFNFWIWKDIATGIQMALFHEWGTVAEHRSDLGDIWRTSYGVGFRLVSASGYVYRADLAAGREGSTVTVIFEYPW
ncbi:MAG: hypothetical protein OEV42_14360 [Deltaproteobacteria bacterium]|nr:hypothetical protein [Deltaproteobacteria bacterium]